MQVSKFDLLEAAREYFCNMCEVFNIVPRTNLVACSGCGTEDRSVLTTSYQEDDPEMDGYMTKKDLGEGD